MSDTFESLADFRTKQRLTLQALADQFGVNKTTVMRWEAGSIPAERVSEISEKTGLPPSVLRPDLFKLSAEAAQ